MTQVETQTVPLHDPYRIYVVGGCHVAPGTFPVETLFPALLEKALASEFPVKVACSRLAKMDSTVKRLKEIPGRPQMIILQLGNYETSLSIRSGALAAALPEGVRSAQSVGFLPAIWARVRSFPIFAYAVGAIVAKAHSFSPSQFGEMTRKCFAEIATTYPDAKVVVLASFPTLDVHRNILRRIANRILRREAKAMGWVYVDVFAALPSLRWHLFSNRDHLSAAGSKVIAEHLLPVVRELVR